MGPQEDLFYIVTVVNKGHMVIQGLEGVEWFPRIGQY